VRPLIGITSYVEEARWGVWDTTAALVPYSYVRQVEAAGGTVVLVPPNAADAPEVLAVLDGLLLAGGADLDPALYGADAHDQTAGLRPDRDVGEMAALRAADELDLPVLGVCRGMQLMTVAAGGTLHQHLPEVVGHETHRPEPGVYGRHDVRLAAGSRVASVLGESVTVSSYHHQGVDSTGSLTVTAWAEDGSVEAVEDPSKAFAVGVLWHPEVGDDPRIFEALVEAARAARTRRAHPRATRTT
jgi:putative glutamine amidotransferase